MKSESFEIKIPQGIQSSQVIKLTGLGHIGKDESTSGDLYLKVFVTPHKKFRRENFNIFSDEEVAFSQAVLGDKIKIDTLDGEVSLKLQSGMMSGQEYRLKGRGSYYLNSHKRGDHYVKVIIKVPKTLNAEQKRLLEELRKNDL